MPANLAGVGRGNPLLGARSACSGGTLAGIHHPGVAGIFVCYVGSLARYSAATVDAPVDRIAAAGSRGHCTFLPALSGSYLAFPGIHRASDRSTGALDGPSCCNGVGCQTAEHLVDHG